MKRQDRYETFDAALPSQLGRKTFTGKFSGGKRLRALKVIDDCGGNLTLASSRLGVSVATLSRWRAASRESAAV